MSSEISNSDWVNSDRVDSDRVDQGLEAKIGKSFKGPFKGLERFGFISVILMLSGGLMLSLLSDSTLKEIRKPSFKFVDRAFGENAGDAPLRVCAAKLGYNPITGAAGDATDRRDSTIRGSATFTRGTISFDSLNKCLEGNLKPSSAVGDLDGDYLPEVITLDNTGKFLLYWNNGGSFGVPEVLCFFSEEECLTNSLINNTLSVIIDVNGDGRLDIVVVPQAGSNAMFVKFGLGERKFSEGNTISVNGLVGLPDTAVTFDLNKDGISDIIYSVRTSFLGTLQTQLNTGETPRVIRVMLSTGGKFPYFEDKTVDWIPMSKRDESIRGRDEGVSENAVLPYQPFTPLIHDFDQDGEYDLFVAADFGGSRIFFWDKKREEFVDYTRESGVYGSFAGMGATLYDFNKDGLMDIFATEIAPDWSYCNHDRACDYSSIGNTIFLNQGDRTFLVSGSWSGVEEARLGAKFRSEFISEYDPGLRKSGWGWGFSTTDLNNDGSVDFFIGVGQNSKSRGEFDWTSSYQRPYLFLGDGNGGWRESTGDIFRSLIMPGTSAMVSSLDFDGDFRSDLMIGGEDNRRPYLLLNRTVGGGGGLLVVKGKGLGGSPLTGEGALVKFKLGGKWDSFEVSSKNSNFRVHGSAAPIPIGFGDHKFGVVEVVFPSGKVVERKVYPFSVNIITEE